MAGLPAPTVELWGGSTAAEKESSEPEVALEQQKKKKKKKASLYGRKERWWNRTVRGALPPHLSHGAASTHDREMRSGLELHRNRSLLNRAGLASL